MIPRIFPFLLVSVMITAIFFPYHVPDVDAYHETEFSNDSTEKTITFLSAGTDDTTSVTVEGGSVLTSAELTIKGSADNSGNYPLNLSLDVGGDGDKEWKFKGSGYGSLGKQWQLNDSAPQKTIAFDSGGINTDWSILLPKTAQVTSATIDLNRGDMVYFFQPGTAGKDTQASGGSLSNNNWGTYVYLMTNFGSGSPTRGFCEFDISAIPANMVISSATMSFYHAMNANVGQSLELRQVLGAWGETTLTWNNQPSNASTQIDTAQMGGMNEWLDFDVMNVVQDWVDGVSQNYGVRISGINGAYSSAYVRSSDTPTVTEAPKLEVVSSISPQNPTLDIGNDGDQEFSHSGELLSVVTTPDLSLELNSLIQSLPVHTTDDYGNQLVKIPIKLTISNPGSTMSITNISIKYDFEAPVTVNPDSIDLITEFNSHIGSSPGDVTIPIHVRTNSAGKVTLGDLNLTYNSKPRFLSDIPNLVLAEDTHVQHLYDISSHFIDDYDSASDLSYQVLYVDPEQEGLVSVSVVDGTFLDVDATRVPNWNSEEFPNSTYITVNIMATDGGSRSVGSNQFLISVTAVNDEPLPNPEKSLDDLLLSEEGLTSLDLDAEPYFYDIESDILSFDARVDPLDVYDGENITVEVSSTSGILTVEGGLDFNGEQIPVWIFCDDDPQVNTTDDGPGNYVYRELMVDVEPINDEPLWLQVPKIEVYEDTPAEDVINLYEYVTDIETGSQDLTYSITHNPASSFIGVEIDANGNIDVTSLGVNYYGTAELEITASDEEDESETTLQLVVLPVNDPPTVSFMEPRAESLLTGTISIRGNGNDIEASLKSVELSINQGEWVTAEGLTVWSHTFDTTTVENGPCTIEVRSYDGELYSEESSLSVLIENHPKLPPAISISYPSEGVEVSGKVEVQGITTPSSSDITNVTIRMGPHGQWLLANGTQLWTYSLDTTAIPNGPLLIQVRAYDGELFSSIMTLNITINNTDQDDPGFTPPDLEEETEDPSGSSYNWWLITVIIIVVLLLLVVVSNKKKQQEKEAAAVAALRTSAIRPALQLASPVQPAPGSVGASAQSPYQASPYGPGFRQPAYGSSRSPYQGTSQAPPPQLQTSHDDVLQLPKTSITSLEPTQGYGSQGVPQSGPSPYQEQLDTPILPPAPESVSTETLVACFSCGGSVPVPEGATIITCPQCGTKGQL